MNNSQIASMVIHDLETLKVIADPLRTQILELLIQEPLTVRQLGEKLGLASSRLYYHVNLLEKYGLILVTETRLVANMLEKTYGAVAHDFDLDPELLSFCKTPEGNDHMNTLLTSSIDATRDDLLRSMHARTFQIDQGQPEHSSGVLIGRQMSRVSDKRADEFRQRLCSLLDEFTEADQETPETGKQAYAMTVIFYPSFYFHEPEAPDEADPSNEG
jgi:DNA-binding transcriptional ArsR family regulator